MKIVKIKWLVFLGISILAILFLLILFSEKPPKETISTARLNLSKAEILKASKYTKGTYEKARLYFDSAMIQWSYENDKFFFNRDFNLVKAYAVKSNSYSLKAMEQSVHNALKMENNINSRITELNKKFDFLNKQFGNFPFNELSTNKLTKCKLLLNEVVIAVKQSEYLIADQKLDSAELIMQQLAYNYESLVQEYFENYPAWKKLVEKAILNSKKNQSYCIVIDKYSRECLLYKKGELKEKFTIELGSNWIGDKNHQGDKSTPEGFYKIIAKKKNGETKYYKAFLLDYPNEDDKKRFLSNKEKGIIKKDAKIGNLIEIHGNGGKGIDWTDGCIALHNKDMDDLYEVCSVGTTVIIVGSVKSLDEIYNY